MTVDIVNVVKRLGLKNISPVYLEAFDWAQRNQLLEEYEINTPLRIAHFLAQLLHESAGFTLLRENMSYSAKRIVEVFGVNKHSAAITASEAKQLERNPQALAERVYGLGNPRKAKELGNTRKGDGYVFRGGGPLQITGGAKFKQYSKDLGIDLYDNPSLVTDYRYVLKTALIFWKNHSLNSLADKDNLRGITKIVNGGYNGYNDRLEWFNLVWKVVGKYDNSPAWLFAQPDNEVLDVQKALNELGANPQLEADGKMGPKTEVALRKFQKDNSLRVDGIIGPATTSKIAQRLESGSRKSDLDPGSENYVPTETEAPKDTTTEKGVTLAGAGISGEYILNQVDGLRQYVADNQYLSTILTVLAVAGVLIIIYGKYKEFKYERDQLRPRKE